MTESVQILVLCCEARAAAPLSDALLEAGAGAVEQKPELNDGLATLWVYPGLGRRVAVLRTLAEQWAETRGLSLSAVESELGSDWQHSWQQSLRPFAVHSGLTIVPVIRGRPIEESRPADGRELFLEAGFAFGYGEHPTTRMISTWLATVSKDERVLDFGTGSGILALIALASGAESAVGLDIDKEALVLARKNADLNGFSPTCSFSHDALAHLRSDFGVAVANVDAMTLEQSAGEICRLVSARGRIALTGLLVEQQAAVMCAFSAHGVTLSCSQSEDDWVLLTGQQRP